MSVCRAALLALLLMSCRAEPAAPPPEKTGKGELALLTSLPLAFSEGFSLQAPPHPAMRSLEERYTVRLVDGPEQLPAGGLLLAIQPQALTGERLVALDRWVRDGGRVLLLTDPRLTWESALPIGDKRRPPYAFPDTGLLAHWGLELQGPTDDGPAMRTLADLPIQTGSPGALASGVGSPCPVSVDRLVARCALGKGRAVVIADADFVQVQVPGGLDGPTDRNLDALILELAALQR